MLFIKPIERDNKMFSSDDDFSAVDHDFVDGFGKILNLMVSIAVMMFIAVMAIHLISFS